MTWEEVKKGNRDISLFFSSLLGEIDIYQWEASSFFFLFIIISVSSSLSGRQFAERLLQRAGKKEKRRERERTES